MTSAETFVINAILPSIHSAAVILGIFPFNHNVISVMNKNFVFTTTYGNIFYEHHAV